MPRVLVMTERFVSASDRTGYVTALALRKQHAAAGGANFWVFEKTENPESFLEFVEAGSSEALSAAMISLNREQTQTLSSAPVWREVTGA